MPHKILVLDDDVLVRSMLNRLLVSDGHQVTLTATPEQAIRASAEDRPDLALLDINLHQELNGIDVARQLGERQGVPVVFFTSFTDPDLAAAAAICRPRGYLIKPCSPAQLRVTLAAVLEAGDSADTSGAAADLSRDEILGALSQHGLNLARGQVALLRSQGQSVAEVAKRLSLSVHTVRAYEHTARRALGMERIEDLACWLGTHRRDLFASRGHGSSRLSSGTATV